MRVTELMVRFFDFMLCVNLQSGIPARVAFLIQLLCSPESATESGN